MNDLTKRDSGFLSGVQGIQWAVFMLTNIIAVPVVVGAAFHMSPAEISTFMQRMLFVSGSATLIQVFIGHRLPVVEGAAGMWWAIFILLGTMSAPGNQVLLLQQLEMGLIIAGLFLAILGFLPIIEKVRLLFTPIVTGVYLILLVAQLSGSFFKSILGITATGQLNGKIALICIIEIIIILLFSLKVNGIWKSMGPLVGIVVGWLLFHFFGLLHLGKTYEPTSWFAVPKLLDWGSPKFDAGIVLTSIITSVVLISNVIASILVVGIALEKEIQPKQYQKGIFGNGVNLFVSGIFSVVGVVPLSVSAGFITTTGIKKMRPLVIGAILIMAAGFFPYIGGFLSTLPLEVAYASLFIPFSQMMGFGIRDLMGQEPSSRNLLVIGLSLMVGIGMMFMPPQGFESVVPWLRNIVANGLLVGLIFCLFLEHVLFREKKGAVSTNK
ncbi:xanthine/uracil/vitamin C permease [Neobacillus bataviensis LMG 21833]|uniref:Xanthine/uracil/vitamin C permease n=1 Tax=Neobacillus bataviensis LMG 21833 TaxID=1117379 RepID=K6D130_9BACI|nr:purine/pyrimidine permease [Neobacillus bataviensis]EKN66192.1 xanthine/uracil/vitamin C permease [Neobacillus bataviensis LMG 21833]